MSKQKYPTTTTTTSGTVSARKGRDHYSFAKQQARRNKRRDQAEDRQAKYDTLSTKEKLANCIPGGSKRELARLEAKVAATPAPAPAPKMKAAKKA